MTFLKYFTLLLTTTVSISLGQTQSRTSEIPESRGYPVLPNQKLGPNDLIEVSVYDERELTRLVRVTADGMVRLPMMKRAVLAQGLMPVQLEDAIAEELKAENLILSPIVTVTVAEYKNYSVTVMGAVKNPLTFQAPNPVKLLDALSFAGGLTGDAGSEILISKSNTDSPGSANLTQRVATEQLLNSASPDLNIFLTGGEEVRVPEAPRLYVVGDVKQPGAFPIKGENGTTVLEAIALAQGLDRQGVVDKNAYIFRQGQDGSKKEIVVDLKGILDRKSPDVTLVARDVLYIPEDQQKKVGLAVLEKIALFAATGGAAALAYGTLR